MRVVFHLPYLPYFLSAFQKWFNFPVMCITKSKKLPDFFSACVKGKSPWEFLDMSYLGRYASRCR
jgi:hypothetical protein